MVKDTRPIGITLIVVGIIGLLVADLLTSPSWVTIITVPVIFIGISLTIRGMAKRRRQKLEDYHKKEK